MIYIYISNAFFVILRRLALGIQTIMNPYNPASAIAAVLPAGWPWADRTHTIM